MVTKEDVIKQVKDNGVEFIRLWFTDINGILKSFAIGPDELEGALTQGMGFDGSSITGFQSRCGGVPVGVERKETSPIQSVRLINHPNPFNSSTTISFFIPEGISHSTVELNVYDERGQQIKQLLKSVLPSGEYAVRWDATDGSGRAVASGVYFYHLIVGSERQIGKMSLVK